MIPLEITNTLSQVDTHMVEFIHTNKIAFTTHQVFVFYF